MTWFILALSASLCWAVGQVLVKKGFENIPPLWNNIFTNFLILILHIVPVLFLSNFSIKIPPVHIFIIIVASASGYHTFFYAISKGEVSLTGTVCAGYPIFTIILSQVFLNERLSLFQSIGVGLVITGVVFIALPERAASKEIKNHGWILWGLICAMLIGSGDFLAKFSINHIGAYSHIFFLALISNPIGAINYLIDRKGRRFPDLTGKKALPTFLGLIVVAMGTFLFLISFEHGKVSLIAPVSSIYPAITAVLAVRFLGEKITLKQGFGIAIIVIGLILVGIVSI
ncbi:MAG: DMT family transporter [Spirochaetota bacterium]|nr:MAG: DMT family transporter [Spirochaetota bacterium]